MVFENNKTYRRPNPYCEPMLSRNQLYPDINTNSSMKDDVLIYMYLLSYCDGTRDLIDIADLIGMKVYDLLEPVESLKEKGLIS